jgi:hypothetical protein
MLSKQAGEDVYAIELEATGVHTSSTSGLGATNKPFRFKGASIGHLGGNGKIVENRDYYNRLGTKDGRQLQAGWRSSRAA